MPRRSIVPASTPAIFHRKLIIMLAARHRLPAVYPYRFFVADGGLISYGADSVRLEVDDQLIIGRRLHRQVARLLALEDAVHVASRAPDRSGSKFRRRYSPAPTR